MWHPDSLCTPNLGWEVRNEPWKAGASSTHLNIPQLLLRVSCPQVTSLAGYLYLKRRRNCFIFIPARHDTRALVNSPQVLARECYYINKDP